MVADKIRELRKKIEQRERNVERERTASRNRVARGDPETAGERAQVAVIETKDLAGATKSFLQTRVAPASDVVAGGGEDGDGAGGGFFDGFLDPPADARGEEMRPPADADAGLGNTVIADETTTVVTPEAATYAGELEKQFGNVSVSDTDGVIEPGDLRVGEDIDRDGEIERGELFRPSKPPREQDEVPRNRDRFDDILI